MRCARWLIAGLLITSSAAQAALDRKVTLKGEIKNFDSEKVVLQTDAGSVLISRNTFDLQKIDTRPGKRIVVQADLPEVLKLNQKYGRGP